MRQGDQDAAWTIIEIYGPHIKRVVRRDMHPRLRSRYDSADFVQSVWASFFRQPSQFRRLNEPKELLNMLLTVARNKVVDETRRSLQSQKRDPEREEPPDDDTGEAVDIDMLPSNDPRPSQVAVAREQWNRLYAEQTREIRRILEMRFAGASYEEIAAKVKLHLARVETAFASALARARIDGEVAPGVGPESAAFLLCVLQGLNVLAKTKPGKQVIEGIVDVALKGLTSTAPESTHR